MAALFLSALSPCRLITLSPHHLVAEPQSRPLIILTGQVLPLHLTTPAGCLTVTNTRLDVPITNVRYGVARPACGSFAQK